MPIKIYINTHIHPQNYTQIIFIILQKIQNKVPKKNNKKTSSVPEFLTLDLLSTCVTWPQLSALLRLL